MAKFAVHGTVIGSKYLGSYEAKNKKKAIEMAQKEAGVYLCHQCSRECEDPEVVKLIAEKE